MISAIVAALLVLGAGFMNLAGLGIFRMPDLFTRMHASTKGASLGVALLLIGSALHFQDLAVATKALITVTFIFLTAPVAAQMLGRAAYAKKVELWEESIIDEGRGHIGASHVDGLEETEPETKKNHQDVIAARASPPDFSR